VVIDDGGRHLRGREVGVIHLRDVASVLVGRQRFGQELLPSARGEQDDDVSKIDDGDAPALGEPPSTTHLGWDGHLPALGNQEFGGGHRLLLATW
jgi:hypothetical protein